MMRSFKVLFSSVCLIVTVGFSGPTESLDLLLDTFAHNSDLSKKTRLENAGNVIIFTREELDRMQARNLKDVLKTLPILKYSENRWGFPDPNYVKQELPYNSKGIRIYIDNQEITTASYGSGLSVIGDIDLGFVDHIEIYSLNPSFEYSTEAAHYLIKLYSKVPDRDKGGKVEVSMGSRGFNHESIQYAHTGDAFSYYTYISRLDDQRKRYESFESPLSKDKERYFIFSTLSTDAHHLQFQTIQYENNTFIGLSSDGKIDISKHKGEYIHIGYENRTSEAWKFKMVWEKGSFDNHFKNDFEELEYTNEDHVLTTDLQHIWKDIDNNELIMGAKYRYKHFEFGEIRYSDFILPNIDYTTQMISSIYLEDHYAVSENLLFTLGAQYSYVDNNHNVEDQDVWLARFGMIYTDENSVGKVFVHRSEFVVEPYLYIANLIDLQRSLKPEKVENITQEFQYSKDNYRIRGLLGYSRMQNLIYGDNDIENFEGDATLFSACMEYKYQMNTYNSVFSSLSYIKAEDIPEAGSYEEYKAVVRFMNQIGKFDLFNEVILSHDTLTDENYIDYSVGLSYRYSDKFTLSFKGENVFDRARENIYLRGRRDFSTGQWITFDDLKISPIDQRFYLNVEYLF